MNSQELRVCFKGLLANVDSSILQMNFNHGFKIESFSEEETMALFSRLERDEGMAAASKYFLNYQCFNFTEHRMYVISKSFGVMSSQERERDPRFLRLFFLRR